MQTRLTDPDSPAGQRANAVLRRCVHCGFCNATCPTFNLLGDELDGPRGRIYQIKTLLEGTGNPQHVRLHLDRCLTCRACETTCPSGVRYSELVEIGRDAIEHQIPRSGWPGLQRRVILALLPHRQRFAWAIKLSAWLRPFLPPSFKPPKPDPMPDRTSGLDWPQRQHPKQVLLLEGCVQPTLSPRIDRKLAMLLDAIGIQLIRLPQTECCGAVSHHLDAVGQACDTARHNIDAILNAKTDATIGVLMSASACELELREYPQLLQDDDRHKAAASQVSGMVLDPLSLLRPHFGTALTARFPHRKIAVQEPCTLQHGLKRAGGLTLALKELGYDTTPVRDGHLCCGSAGTYSVLQPELSKQLRRNKLDCLLERGAEAIVTANIGCLHHLKAASPVPVVHWLELVQPTA